MRAARPILSFVLILSSTPQVNSQQSIQVPAATRDPQAMSLLSQCSAAMGSPGPAATFHASGTIVPANQGDSPVPLVLKSRGTDQQLWQMGAAPESIVVSAGSSATSHKFTGKERDSESGLDNFEARYMSSFIGRFMSPDPENAGADNDDPQSWNAYSYARNNPINAADPSGLNCVWDNGSYDAEDDRVTGTQAGCESQGGTWMQQVTGDWNPNANEDLAFLVSSEQNNVASATVTLSHDEQIKLLASGISDLTTVSSVAEVARHGMEGAMTAEAAWNLPSTIRSLWGLLRSAKTLIGATQALVKLTGAIDRIIQTSAGPVRVTAEITAEGSTAVVKDLLIYPADSASNLEVGVTELRQGMRALTDELKASGYTEMRVEGAYRTSGINPGRTTTFTVKLK